VVVASLSSHGEMCFISARRRRPALQTPCGTSFKPWITTVAASRAFATAFAVVRGQGECALRYVMDPAGMLGHTQCVRVGINTSPNEC